MTNTTKYLDALKARHGSISDYRAAQILGVTRASVSKWRNGLDSFSPTSAEKVANALGIDPARVVIEAQIDRAKTPEERHIWEDILRKATGAACALVLAFGLFATLPSDAIAAPEHFVLCKVLLAIILYPICLNPGNIRALLSVRICTNNKQKCG